MTSFDTIKETKPIKFGEWEEVGEADDYFSKNALSKLGQEQRNLLEKQDEECRAKTLQEVIAENVSASDQEGQSDLEQRDEEHEERELGEGSDQDVDDRIKQ